MEQKRQLTRIELENIGNLRDEYRNDMRERGVISRDPEKAIADGYADGYTECAERSVPLSEFIKLRNALHEAVQQIEYMQQKFQETGSGNTVISRSTAALQSTEHLMPKS